MGDLKKKNQKNGTGKGFIVDTGHGKEIIVEHGDAAKNKAAVEILRRYVQKFYEIQEEKLEDDKKKDEE